MDTKGRPTRSNAWTRPGIAGRIDGSPEQHHLIGEMRGGAIVVKALPRGAFVPGKRLPVWHSPGAPNFLVFGTEVNDVPVASLPERPDVIALLGYLAWLRGTLFAGFAATAWVAGRWSRTYGNQPMRHRAGTVLRNDRPQAARQARQIGGACPTDGPIR